MRNRPGSSVFDGLASPSASHELNGKNTIAKNARAFNPLMQQFQQSSQPFSASNSQIQLPHQHHHQNQFQQQQKNRFSQETFQNQQPHFLPNEQLTRNYKAGNSQIERLPSNSSRMSLPAQIRAPNLSMTKQSSSHTDNTSILNMSSHSRNLNLSTHSNRNTPSHIAPMNPHTSLYGQSGNGGGTPSAAGSNYPAKLLIETANNEDNRPLSANTFTSHSATNSQATFQGSKNSLMSTFHKGVSSAKSGQNNQSQEFPQFPQSITALNLLNQVGGSTSGSARYSAVSRNTSGNGASTEQDKSSEFQRNSQKQYPQQYQQQHQQQQTFQHQIPQFYKQQQYQQPQQIKHNVPQQQSQQQHPQQPQQISFVREESPAIRQKPNCFSSSVPKQSVHSMNLKETIPILKQNEEQKRISKSTQGQEIEGLIFQKNQQYQQKLEQKENNNPLDQNKDGLEEGEKREKETPEISGLIKKSDPLPNHEPTKCSFKRNGIVKAYAANTNQGLVRNYNEDRVSIILNIMKPASRANEQWPKCSFFGVYDGHGGVNCADFLRDNLHQFVIKETAFPWNPKEALRNGFLAAEKAFQELAQASEDHIDRSGSCAITVLIVGDTCYVANVGDSRAVLSGDSGQKVYTLSRDHKPGDELEQKRIINGGGKIYQTHATQVKPGAGDQKAQTQLVVGPLRVFPGRLSVSRTFGDIEAKIEKLGGNPNVVISDPEIKSFKITDDHDFIVLASDGVYDKMSSKEVIQSVWSTSAKPEQLQENVHKQCSLGVESILRESLNKRSLDNVTVVMIAFQNYKEKLFGTSEKLPLEEIKNYQPSALTTKPEENSKYLQLQQTLGSKTATAASSASYMADKFSENNEFRLQALTPNNRSSIGEGQIRKKFKENQMFYPQNGVNQQAAPQGNENLCYQPNQGGFTGNNHHNHNNSQFQQNGMGAHLSQQSTISSQQSSNPQNTHTQFNKLRLLDQKISEISQKTNQFQGLDHKIIGNNR